MEPHADAVRRLAASREDIERWLAREQAEQPPEHGPPQDGPPAVPAGLSSLLFGLFARSWLNRPQAPVDPLRLGVAVAEASLRPLARRHPWALLASAAGAGAVLGLSRPWRWGLRPAFLGGLVTPLLSLAASRWLQRQAAATGDAAAPGARPARPSRTP